MQGQKNSAGPVLSFHRVDTEMSYTTQLSDFQILWKSHGFHHHDPRKFQAYGNPMGDITLGNFKADIF